MRNLWLSCLVVVVGACGPEEAVIDEDLAVLDEQPQDLDGTGTIADPDDSDVAFDLAALRREGGRCPRVSSSHLSPDGLGLVIDASTDDAIDALSRLRGYIRNRDIFIVGKGNTDHLLREFPCNRVMPLLGGAQHNEGDQQDKHADGVFLDIEPGGFPGFNYSESFAISNLGRFAQDVHHDRKKAGGVPLANAPAMESYNYAHVHRAANLDFMLLQVQPACKSSLSLYGRQVSRVLGQYHPTSTSIRDVGFEVSIGTGSMYPNGVAPSRAADCVKVLYGRGARVAFFFGDAGHGRWQDLFQALANRGLRKKH